MMKMWALLLGIAGLGSSVYGQHVSVKQLEQFLAQDRAAQRTDEQVAQQLAHFELTERLTESAADRVFSEFHPGKKAAAALELMADQSVFLSPPASELPHKDVPTAAEQQRIIEAAVNFATVTLKHMPNFLATRTTASFEDVPVITSDSAFQSGLHSMGTSVRETAYRDGHEVADNAPVTRRAGLTSVGEFGQDLGIIVTDAAKGSIAWSHWEQTSAGLVAVFQYAVPRVVSHYKIYFCCGWSATANDQVSYEGTPGYHGLLSIDPSSGAILRATLEVEFANYDPAPHYGIAVQYRAVDIDGQKSVLPLRSVSIGNATTFARGRAWRNLYVDDVRFTNYHRFGSTVRIFPSTPDP